MTDRLAGRVIMITGATGIAAAAAERVATEGASVCICARREENASALADRIRAGGGQAAHQAADFGDEAQARAAVEGARAAFGGRIDGLFAVAGGSGRRAGDGPLHQIPLAGWDATFAINATPAFLAAREVLRVMLDQEPNASGTRGSIVLTSSVLATSPSPELFATHAYAAAKSAILGLVRSSAAYYAPQRIRVNAIAPGLVDTPMSARAASDPTTVAYTAEKQPLPGGLLAAEDIAAAAAFLLSDEARAITGQTLVVDGGWSVTEA